MGKLILCLLFAVVAADSVTLNYRSSARAVAILDRATQRVEIDGEEINAAIQGNVLTLTRGQRLVTLQSPFWSAPYSASKSDIVPPMNRNLGVPRTLLVRCFAGLLFLMGAWVAYTQDKGKQPPELKLNKIKDDLYEIEGDGGNVAMYITNEGVIMIDDKYEQDYDQIMADEKQVSKLPIRYILSTHYHADHSGGNTRFAKGTEIISTLNAHNNIVNHVQSNAPNDMIAAPITFTTESDIFLGGKHVQAKYYGRGHTNGDAVIYFPDLKLVHTGDLMTMGANGPGSPLIDYPGGGSVVEWTKTLDEVMKLDFDTVIPGHGPVSKKADMLAYRNNVEKLRTRAQGLIRQGKSQDDVAKVMTAEFNWQPNSLNMQWSLPGMMTELKK